MNLDSSLFFLCTCAEISVIGLLIHRRIWRNFPFFFIYSLWSLLANGAGFVVLHWQPPPSRVYLSFYLIDLLVDSTLLFAALVELAWSVLRPLRESLPRRTLIIISVLILLIAAAIWPFAALPNLTHGAREFALLVQLKQTVATLAILGFIVLAAGSQFLAIGWRDRELQIATGLGLYSLVGMIVTLLHTHSTTIAQYNRLDQLLVGSYLLSLIYWIYSFAHQEMKRRVMSPQAQSILLTMAGAARSTRVALATSQSNPLSDKDDR